MKTGQIRPTETVQISSAVDPRVSGRTHHVPRTSSWCQHTLRLTDTMCDMKRTASWFDLGICLIYPAVLGAVIFAFLDAVAHHIVDPFWIMLRGGDRSTEEGSLFASLGLSPAAGAVSLLLLTLMLAVVFSVDFLYSKYSGADYGLMNLCLDSLISVLLATAYVTMTKSATADLATARAGLGFFWGALLLEYLIFTVWDLSAYRSASPGSQKREFYREMLIQINVVGILLAGSLSVWAFVALRPGIASVGFLTISIVVMAGMCVNFFRFVRRMEAGLDDG